MSSIGQLHSRTKHTLWDLLKTTNIKYVTYNYLELQEKLHKLLFIHAQLRFSDTLLVCLLVMYMPPLFFCLSYKINKFFKHFIKSKEPVNHLNEWRS